MKSFYPRLLHISPFTEVSHSLGNKFLYYFQLKIKSFREIDGNQNVYPGKKQIHKTFPTISRATQTQLSLRMDDPRVYRPYLRASPLLPTGREGHNFRHNFNVGIPYYRLPILY